jgi:hypothetical protein
MCASAEDATLATDSSSPSQDGGADAVDGGTSGDASDTGSPFDAQTDASSCRFEGDSCNFCVANLCIAELTACNGSSACKDATPTFESCICAVQTSDAGTVQACRLTYIAVNQEAHDLSSCIAVACDAQCL